LFRAPFFIEKGGIGPKSKKDTYSKNNHIYFTQNQIMRIFTLILTLGVFSWAYGQQISPTATSKMPDRHGHGNSNGVRAVTANLASTNFYVAGTTMDLTFTVELTNTDAEYGDSLALTFPADITPNSSPTDPIYLATENQPSEALNGVSGQTISWGDNDNNYGGIEPLVLIPFSVNVTIAPGATGPQTVNVHISGDGFGPGPQDFNGTVVVNPQPAGPNAVLSSTDLFSAFTEIGTPIGSQVYNLSNTGGDTLDIDSVNYSVGNAEFTDDFVGATIAPGSSIGFFFTYSPTDLSDDVDTFNIYTNDGTFRLPMEGFAYGNGQALEGFEGTNFFPECQWGNNDADGDGVPWFAYGPSPHTGNASAASASWLGGSVLTPDNWLISPQVTPTATNNFLSWFAAAQDPDFPSDFYEVYVSTTGDDPADFTTSLFSETLVDDVWRVRRIDLSAYIGQNVYLAFRHHNSVDQFIMKIDDVRYPPKTTADANLPPLGISLNQTPSNCPSDSTGALFAILNGGGSIFLYTFVGVDTFATTNSQEVVQGLPAGNYIVQAEDHCGFTASDNIDIQSLNQLDDASFQFAWDTLCKLDSTSIGPVISGLAGGTFTAGPGLVFENSNTGKINVLSSLEGSYQVTYTTNGPCPNTTTATIVIDGACSHVSIDPLANQGLSVYPNPNQGSFFLYNEGNSREASIKVYNLQGQVVFRHNQMLMQGGRHAIDMGDVAPGMYMIEVSSKGQTGIDRLLVH
jgi:hypothetical protein